MPSTMSSPPVSAGTDGEPAEPSSAASTKRRSEVNEPSRPVRIGSTGNMDARAKAKYKELSRIGNVNHAMAHLVKKGYATEDTEWDPTFVTSALIQLTASVPTEESVILKALALVLARIDFEIHGQLMAGAIMQELEEPMADMREMKETTKRAEAAVEDMEDEVQRIKKATEDMRTELDESRSSENDTLIEIQQAIERLQETVKNTAQHPVAAPKLPADQPERPRAHSTTSTDYDRLFPALPEIPLSQRIGPPIQLPPSHASTIARAEQRARQVLFRPIADMPPHKLGELSHEAIVKKANVALETLATKRRDIPKGMTFLGVNILTRGDIVFDLNSREAADWLRREDVKTSYMEGFGALTEIVDREHSVVVENVPVTFEPGVEAFTQVEGANGLERGCILLGRWFKKKEDRSPKQRTAFMKIFFKSAEMANKAIRDRILIGGRRCAVRKLLPEPRRCFKCQKLDAGHMAHQCPLEYSICGNCAQHHITQKCPVTDEIAKHKCSNCDKEGHGAGNRECPKYAQKRKDLQGRNSELLYKFFPTADDTTWELLDPSAPALLAYIPPVEQYQAMNNRHLAWIEERKKWLDTTRTKGGPSQAERAKNRRDQIAKEAIETSSITGGSTLKQTTLNFTDIPASTPGTTTNITTRSTLGNEPRPTSAPPTPSIRRENRAPELDTTGPRSSTRVDFSLGEIRTERRIMANGQLSDISFLQE